MQIVPFPAYYQSVYTNFDFTSFSLISCCAKEAVLHGKTASFEMQNNIFLIMLLVSRFVEPPLLKSIYRAVVFRNYPQ
jgi:hypothetical protein